MTLKNIKRFKIHGLFEMVNIGRQVVNFMLLSRDFVWFVVDIFQTD